MTNSEQSLIEQLKDAAHALPGFNDEMVRLSDAIAIVRQHDPHPTVWNWKNTNNGSLWGTPREHKPVPSSEIPDVAPDPRSVKALLKDVYFRKVSTSAAFDALAPYLAIHKPVSSAQQSLFKHGTFTSHSGLQLPDKIDCDALTDADWDAVSAWFASRLTFGQVVGIPQGGLALARALEKHVTTGPTLIVDDVLTTGRSMEEARKDHPGAIGAVLFSRTRNVPIWITARWVESDMADTRQPVGLTLNDSPEKQMPRGEIELILHSHHVSFCRRFKAEGKPKDAEWAMDEAEAVLLGRRPIERESGWQPIETVPDDVDRVLGYSASGGQDGSPCVADIRYEQGTTTEGWWEAVDGNRFWPTHWMPLPPNPTGIEGRE